MTRGWAVLTTFGLGILWGGVMHKYLGKGLHHTAEFFHSLAIATDDGQITTPRSRSGGPVPGGSALRPPDRTI